MACRQLFQEFCCAGKLRKGAEGGGDGGAMGFIGGCYHCTFVAGEQRT